MTVKPIKFSELFNIDKATLSKFGVFDPILNIDTKLFVDPLLLKTSASHLMRGAFENYNKFFAVLLELLSASQSTNDKCWREAKRRVKFPEFKYTCLGYSNGTISGSGTGAHLNEKILQSAKEIVNFAKNNADIFLLLPLLEERIGADIISDMTQNIIEDDICEYTLDVIKQLGITGTIRHRSRNNKIYLLPENPTSKCPIMLVPLDILASLPLADSFDHWLVDMSNQNAILREQINTHIGHTWYDANKTDKKEHLLKLIKQDKDFFLSVLHVLQEHEFEPYDLQKDCEGLYRWLEDSYKTVELYSVINKNTLLIDSDVSLAYIVETCVINFKHLIEEDSLRGMFWAEQYSKLRHVKEFYSQMLFYMVCSMFFAASDLKVTIERLLNKKIGQVDCKFSMPGQKSIHVQVKNSNNPTGIRKIYENTVEKYETCSSLCAFFVVMDFSKYGSDQINDIRAIECACCKLIEIDVWRDASSKNEMGDIPDFGSSFIDFEGLDIEDVYFNEKSKAGKSSHKQNKPLKEIVAELCIEIMTDKHYPSAMQLCNDVAKIVEAKHMALLEKFRPYINAKKNGTDWKQPTFYKWCKDAYKTSPVLCE